MLGLGRAVHACVLGPRNTSASAYWLSISPHHLTLTRCIAAGGQDYKQIRAHNSLQPAFRIVRLSYLREEDNEPLTDDRSFIQEESVYVILREYTRPTAMQDIEDSAPQAAGYKDSDIKTE